MALGVGDRTAVLRLLSRFRAAVEHWDILALVMLPQMLFLLDDSWMYSANFSDAWLYFGYFRDLSDHLRIFDGTYYGTRLSAILPGALFHHFLPLWWANWALHSALFYTTVFSLFGAARIATNRRAALLSAFVLGSNYFFLIAVGTDYVDGYGMAYLSLAFLLVTKASRSERRTGWLLGAGACMTAVVVANSTWVLVAPCVVFCYLVATRERGFAFAARGLAWIACGCASIALLFCLISWLLAGRFWFLGPAFQWVANYTAGGSNPWRFPLSTWLPRASWLVLTASTVVGALVWMLNRMRGGVASRGMTASCFQVQLIGLVTTFALLQCVWFFNLLDLRFYSSLLLPAGMLALAAQMAPLVAGLSTLQFRALSVLSLIALGSGVLAGNWRMWHLSDYVASSRVPEGLCLAAAVSGSAGVLLLRARTSRAMAAVAALVGLGLSNGFARMSFRNTDILWPFDDPAATLEAVAETSRMVKPLGSTEKIWFWYDQKEPLEAVFQAIAFCYLGQYRLVNIDFPSLDPGTLMQPGAITARSRVVVMSQEPDAFGRASRAFADRALDTRLLAHHQVAVGRSSFSVDVVQLMPMQSPEPLKAVLDPGAIVGKLSKGTDGALPLEYFVPNHATAFSIGPIGVRVTSFPNQWYYAVHFRQMRVESAGHYHFTLRYRPIAGEVRLAAVGEDWKTFLGRSGPPRPEGSVWETSMEVRLRAGKQFFLVVVNESPNGQAAEFEIVELTAFRGTRQ